MPARTLATVVLTRGEAEWLIAASCELARTLDAHLNVVFPVQTVFLYGGSGVDPMLVPEVAKWQTDSAKEAKGIFDEAVRRSGIQAEFRTQAFDGGPAESYMLAASRGADLVVIGPVGEGHDLEAHYNIRAALVRNVGRPVLVMPKGHPLTGAARHLLVGWSDTREATRAAHDGTLLAAPGAAIDLLSVRSGRAQAHAMDTREDVAAALDRQGYRVSLVDREAPAGATADTLFDTAREQGADLVVTGAFGHSAIYDFIVGAVTSRLLRAPEFPVLLEK